MPRMVLALLVGLAGLSPASSQEPVVWVASPWQHAAQYRAWRGEVGGDRRRTQRVRAAAGHHPRGCAGTANVRVEAMLSTGPAGQIEAGNVALFREHYIHVFKPSYASKRRPTGTRTH